jgi:hypothetical protein
MASRSTNTLGELIERWMADLAQYKLRAPEDEMPLVAELESALMGIARRPIDDLAQSGLTQAPPSAMQQGGMPQMPSPGGVPGVRTNPGLPSSNDEMRRMLSFYNEGGGSIG